MQRKFVSLCSRDIPRCTARCRPPRESPGLRSRPDSSPRRFRRAGSPARTVRRQHLRHFPRHVLVVDPLPNRCQRPRCRTGPTGAQWTRLQFYRDVIRTNSNLHSSPPRGPSGARVHVFPGLLPSRQGRDRLIRAHSHKPPRLVADRADVLQDDLHVAATGGGELGRQLLPRTVSPLNDAPTKPAGLGFRDIT